MKKTEALRPGHFLTRWSRRKLSSALAEPSISPPSSSGAVLREPAEPGVDEDLRRLVLRALFNDPQFSIRDGLDDYDGDYTFFEARGEVMTQDMLRVLAGTETKPDADSVNDADAALAANHAAVEDVALQSEVS